MRLWIFGLSLGILLSLLIFHRKSLIVSFIIKRPHTDAALSNLNRAFKPYQDGEYKVISDLVTPPGAAEVKVSDTDITVCSQTSVGNLFQVVPLAEAWGGRISVAVFTYDDRVDVTLAYILLLRRCSPEVRQKTSFHLVAPVNRAPETLNVTENQYQATDCGLLTNLKIKFTEENFFLGNVKYPVNILRNTALAYARTPYVMNLDVDILPSYDLHAEMVSFLRKLNETETLRKTLYVVPCFESSISNGIFLKSKTDLIEAKRKGTIRPLWVRPCPYCQNATDYERWFSLPYPGEMSVAYSARYHSHYEPFYIALKKTLPPFDGRFKQFGLNRASQVWYMYKV